MINSRDPKDLHPAVKRGAEELMRRMETKGYPVGISSTYRDNEKQDALYAQGRTAPGNIVTRARAGQSMHNHKTAFDIFKNVRGQEFSDAKFFEVAGQIWMEMGGEWGGSWKEFVDRPHFQWTNGLTLKQLQANERVPLLARMPWERDAPVVPNDIKQAKYRVTASSLNIRTGAGVEYAKVAGNVQYKTNDVVVVLEEKAGWGRTDKGWVSLKYAEKI